MTVGARSARYAAINNQHYCPDAACSSYGGEVTKAMKNNKAGREGHQAGAGLWEGLTG